MLRELFRDEACEALERLITRLLQAASTGPPDETTLSELMRTTHTLKGSAGTVGLTTIAELTHRLEDQLARVRSHALPWSSALVDRLVGVIDAIRSVVDVLGDPAAELACAARAITRLDTLAGRASDAVPEAIPHPLGDEVSAAVHSTPHDALDAEVLQSIPSPLSSGKSAAEVTHSVVAGEASDSLRREAASPGVYSSILRVDSARVDQLMDSVGELTFDRTRIERRVQQLRTLAKEVGRTRQELRSHLGAVRAATDDARRQAIEARFLAIESDLARQVTQLSQTTASLIEDADALRRTTSTLQDGLTRVRMQTARTLFQRLARSFRVAVRDTGKEVRMLTSGEDVEFDKALAEQLLDPLTQLLRNAVAHGIEPAHQRRAAGKEPQGLISVAARQEGGLMVLEVADDGHGIEPGTLRRQFVASGRWSATRARITSDEEVIRAVFEPGMSTRDEVDELSGRGVGLDVVRETIARLGGEIRLTSTPGKGTRFTMRLPVSAAVSQALLFKVDGHVYALPNVHVTQTVQVSVEARAAATLLVHGTRQPLLDLHRVLGTTAPRAVALPGVVLEYAGKQLAFTCDKLVGPREIVIKPLGPLLAPLPLYAGATISGSGKVQLILDPAALVALAYPDGAPIEAPIESSASAPQVSQLLGRALVVDDSRAIREALSRMLSSEGFIVDLAEDGARAWAMVAELAYDVVLTDLEMPRLGGFQLVAKLRADERFHALPVVVVSSRATAANRRRAEELGARGFLAKPVTKRKLLDALRGL